ncbi:hypothetical protein GCM10019016_049230 [Streptomyces prasinosporus]|uniref:Uncharacterized protein n=1 Tax=Streptomyces prasinosporus TaxID=68256 RepID=A0ABP6TSM3_9ACTN|nr:hypothetical protein GCM10010332_22900 [Streptomyces albogriseolus]
MFRTADYATGHASSGTAGPPGDPYATFTEQALRASLRELDRVATGPWARRSTPTWRTPCSGTP